MSNINHPKHYNKYPIEVIKLIDGLTFPLGNVVKYLLRAPFKGKLKEDIAKAQWYAKYVLEDKQHCHLPVKVEEFDVKTLVQICRVIDSNVEDAKIATGIMMAINGFYWSTQVDPYEEDLSTVFASKIKKRNAFLRAVCKIDVDKIEKSAEPKEGSDTSDKTLIACSILAKTLESALDKVKSIVLKKEMKNEANRND